MRIDASTLPLFSIFVALGIFAWFEHATKTHMSLDFATKTT